jgi:type II secretory ATPase GspE/PulE/Tfp pilus assembly ATPase PilB-like protein
MMQEIGMPTLSAQNMKLYEATWCTQCNHSGYKGRIWIYEIITLNNSIRELIRNGGNVAEVILEARNWDLITMKEDGILKAMRWFTTIEEILRVI